MHTLLQDVRYGLRMLAKAPAFTAMAVAALAIGIGANAAIFSLINAVLLRPLPGIGDPSSVVTLGLTDPRTGTDFDNSSYANFRDLREQNRVFSGVTAVHGLPVSISGGGPAQRVMAQLVTANFFAVLQVPFAVGHGFATQAKGDPALENDFSSSAGPEVVISHSLWRQRFGGDAGIVGKTIAVNGQTMTVVGVAAEGFAGTSTTVSYDAWVPMWTAAQVLPPSFHFQEWLQNRDAVWLMLYARLQPGVGLRSAQADVDTIAARIRAIPGVERAAWKVVGGAGLEPGDRRDLEQISAMLMGVVALLLLLACANVANLVLARSTGRRREMAVRQALGAPRSRLVGQLLTENAVLALLGGAAGLAFSFWATAMLARLFSPAARFPLAVSLSPDIHVLLFTLGVSAVAAIAFGVAPALQGSKSDLFLSLKEAVAASPRRGRLRPLLVGVQLALSLVLLVGAGLLLRTIRNFSAIPLGFGAHNLAFMSVQPSITGHYADAARLRQFHQELLARVEAIPGVDAATLGRVPPLSRSGWGQRARAVGEQNPYFERHGFMFNTVAPNYFPVMGIPLIHGRGFSSRDTAASPLVAVVNESAARMVWPGENPIGKQFLLGDVQAPYQVIGVVADAKQRTPLEKPWPFLYLSMWQPYPMADAQTVIHVRSRLPLAEISTAVQRQVEALDPDVPLFDIKSAGEQIRDSYWQQELSGMLIGIFAIIALLLGAVGMYGVMAYMVSERTREIGIRMALGARPADVLRMILRQAMRVTGIAILAGVASALALSRVMASLLYGVSPRDPLTFAVIVAALTLVALAASYLPARRATVVDPMIALRDE